ncbi:hypothetical protein BH09BAC2_BH09BAC2_05950 [soil metagenome]
MRKRTPLRGMAIAFFVLAISFYNFSRLSESECIRTIHIVTLLVSGMAIGIFMSNLFALLRERNNHTNDK